MNLGTVPSIQPPAEQKRPSLNANNSAAGMDAKPEFVLPDYDTEQTAAAAIEENDYPVKEAAVHTDATPPEEKEDQPQSEPVADVAPSNPGLVPLLAPQQAVAANTVAADTVTAAANETVNAASPVLAAAAADNAVIAATNTGAPAIMVPTAAPAAPAANDDIHTDIATHTTSAAADDAALSLPIMPLAAKTPAAAQATPTPTAPPSLIAAGEPAANANAGNGDAENSATDAKPESARNDRQPTTSRKEFSLAAKSLLEQNQNPASTQAAPPAGSLPAPSAPAANITLNAEKSPLPQTMNLLPPAEQVAVQITKSLKLGTDKIRIQLSPEDLGRVEINLEMGKDASVKAVISADKPETAEWLARDAKQLERALSDAGFKLDQNNLEFRHNQNSHSQHQAPQFGNAHGDSKSGNQGYFSNQNSRSEIDSDPAIIVRNYVATDGGLNIMV